MDQTFDISDSTDWLNTPLSGLARLDSALRCQVCKDFFNNPVITSCCHTFCSLCIRRCLSAEEKCPTCRAPDQVLKLRRNWAMQECVDAFQESRGAVLEFARRGGHGVGGTMVDGEGERVIEGPVRKKRKVDAEMQNENTSGKGVVPRTRSRNRRTDNSVTPTQTVAVDDIENNDDGDYQPDDGLVPCPICNKRMKNEAVFNHLDRCTGPSPKKASQDPTSSLRFPSSRNTPSASSTPQPPQRLPTINYSLLKDVDLRRKLRDLGIPDNGNRQLLQRRHTEWLNLWNANCDSNTPKSKRELLKELDIWERSQGGQASGMPNKVMRKDFDSSAWSTAHTDDYKKLIADARRKRDEAAAKAKEAAAEEARNGNNETEQQQQQFQPQHEHQETPGPTLLPNIQPQVLPQVQPQSQPNSQPHFQPQSQQPQPQVQQPMPPQLHPQAHTQIYPQVYPQVHQQVPPHFQPQHQPYHYPPPFQSQLRPNVLPQVPSQFPPHMQCGSRVLYQPHEPRPEPLEYLPPAPQPEAQLQQSDGAVFENQGQDSGQNAKSPSVEEPKQNCSQGSGTLENRRVMVEDTAAS